jgi:hypothetical protein
MNISLFNFYFDIKWIIGFELLLINERKDRSLFSFVWLPELGTIQMSFIFINFKIKK